MKTVTLTSRIRICVNENDSEIRKNYYKQLRDYEYFTFRCANKMVQSLYIPDALANGFGVDKKLITGEELTKKVGEVFECHPSSMGYKGVSKEFREKLPSTIRASLNGGIRKVYAAEKFEVSIGKRVVRTYKKGIAIPFTKNALEKLGNYEGKFFFNLFKIPFVCILGKDKSDNASVLNKLISGEYSMCDSSIKFKDNKLFLLLVIKIPVEKHKLCENKTLGIDLGISVPLYAATNFGKNSLSIGSAEQFLNTRLAFQKRKRSMQKGLSTASGGRGRKHKLKALNKLKGSERNWVNTYNHTLSKRAIDFAIKNKCKTIIIEDLKGIAKNDANNFLLRNWSFFELQNFIEQKAKKVGIEVIKINPRYTSQRCHNCGSIHKDNRKNQSDFKCISCEHTDNADHNAAKNISIANTKEFKKEIEKYIKKLEKDKKKTLSL